MPRGGGVPWRLAVVWALWSCQAAHGTPPTPPGSTGPFPAADAQYSGHVGSSYALLPSLTCDSLSFAAGAGCNSVMVGGASVLARVGRGGGSLARDVLECGGCYERDIQARLRHVSDAVCELHLTGSRRVRDYVTALTSVRYVGYPKHQDSTPLEIQILWTLGPGVIATLPGNAVRWFRWYAGTFPSWAHAQRFCQEQEFFGAPGYLATLTHEVEMAAVVASRPEDQPDIAWTGGTRYGAATDEWLWVTGPEGCPDSYQGASTSCELGLPIEDYTKPCQGQECGRGSAIVAWPAPPAAPTRDDFIAISTDGAWLADAGPTRHAAACEWGGMGDLSLRGGFFGEVLITTDRTKFRDNVCAEAGQVPKCLDDTTTCAAEDVVCQCFPPALGKRVGAAVQVCYLDECAAECPTCYTYGACLGDGKALAGYECLDPNTSDTSVGDWECRPPRPVTFSPGVAVKLFPDISCDADVHFITDVGGAPSCGCDTMLSGVYAVVYGASSGVVLDAPLYRGEPAYAVTTRAIDSPMSLVLLEVTKDRGARQTLSAWAAVIRDITFTSNVQPERASALSAAVGFGMQYLPRLRGFAQYLAPEDMTITSSFSGRDMWDWQRECASPQRDYLGRIGSLVSWSLEQPPKSSKLTARCVATRTGVGPDGAFTGFSRSGRNQQAPSLQEESFIRSTGAGGCPLLYKDHRPAADFTSAFTHSFDESAQAMLFLRSGCLIRYQGTSGREQAFTFTGTGYDSPDLDYMLLRADGAVEAVAFRQSLPGGVCMWGERGFPCVRTMHSLYHPILLAPFSFDECILYATQCPNQECRDPDPLRANSWECHCIAPATGSAAQEPVSQCLADECAAEPAECPAPKTCSDPDPTTLGDWVCTCPLAAAVGFVNESAYQHDAGPCRASERKLSRSGGVMPFEDLSCADFAFGAGCDCEMSVDRAVVKVAKGYQAGDILRCGSCLTTMVSSVYRPGRLSGQLLLEGDVTLNVLVAAVASVVFSTSSGSRRIITYSLGLGDVLLNQRGWYRAFSAPAPVTWWEAQQLCEARDVFGLTGYLAALESQAEADEVAAAVPFALHTTARYHLGGLRSSANDARWVTGPTACPPAPTCLNEDLLPYPSCAAAGQRCAGLGSAMTATLGDADAATGYIHLLVTPAGPSLRSEFSAGSGKLTSFICEWGGVGSMCLSERHARGAVVVDIENRLEPVTQPPPEPAITFVPFLPPTSEVPQASFAPFRPPNSSTVTSRAGASSSSQTELPTTETTSASLHNTTPEDYPSVVQDSTSPSGRRGNTEADDVATTTRLPAEDGVNESAAAPSSIDRFTVGRPGLAGAVGALSVVVGSGSGAALRQVLALDMECMLQSIEDQTLEHLGGHSEIMQRRRFHPYLSPTQFTLQERYSSGMVFMGFTIVCISAGASMALQRLVLPTENRALRDLDQQGLLRTPSAPLIAFQYLAQGISLGTCYLFFQLPSWEAYAWGFFGIILCVMIAFTLFLRLKQGVLMARGVFIPDRMITNQHMVLLIGSGEWVSRTKSGWVEKYASVLRRYRPACPWYVVVDLAATYALSAAHVMGTTRYKDCGMMKAIAAGVFALLLVADYTFAPHARTRDGWASMITCILQCGSAITLSLGYYNLDATQFKESKVFSAAAAAEASANEEDTEGFELFFGLARLLAGCAEGILVLALVMDVMALAYVVHTGRRVRLQREVDELDRVEERETGAPPRFGGSGEHSGASEMSHVTTPVSSKHLTDSPPCGISPKNKSSRMEPLQASGRDAVKQCSSKLLDQGLGRPSDSYYDYQLGNTLTQTQSSSIDLGRDTCPTDGLSLRAKLNGAQSRQHTPQVPALPYATPSSIAPTFSKKFSSAGPLQEEGGMRTPVLPVSGLGSFSLTTPTKGSTPNTSSARRPHPAGGSGGSPLDSGRSPPSLFTPEPLPPAAEPVVGRPSPSTADRPPPHHGSHLPLQATPSLLSPGFTHDTFPHLPNPEHPPLNASRTRSTSGARQKQCSPPARVNGATRPSRGAGGGGSLLLGAQASQRQGLKLIDLKPSESGGLLALSKRGAPNSVDL